MTPITLATGGLLIVWLGGMAWMQQERQRGCEPQARWVQTAQGGLWIRCANLPKKGAMVRGHAHFGPPTASYEPQLARRGCLHATDHGYAWEDFGAPRDR